MDFETARFNMIEQQIRTWDVFDSLVLDACSKVHRELFVPELYKQQAFTDTPIVIGHGQAMMAPKIEARLLQALEIQPTDRVLEIGTGSGYLTALLATLAAHVTTIEIHADLADHAKASLRRAGIGNVQQHTADGLDGWTAAEPYDVIVVGGSLPERRPIIERQLALGGRMFVVVGSGPAMEALLITRADQDTWNVDSMFETELPPLVGAEPKPEFKF